MPRAKSDTELLAQIRSLVDECNGNQSEAARRMGLQRLDINRLLKQQGRVTRPKGQRLWAGLERAGSRVGDLHQIKTLQEIQDLPTIALQVLQYMADAVQDRERKGRAAND